MFLKLPGISKEELEPLRIQQEDIDNAPEHHGWIDTTILTGWNSYKDSPFDANKVFSNELYFFAEGISQAVQAAAMKHAYLNMAEAIENEHYNNPDTTGPLDSDLFVEMHDRARWASKRGAEFEEVASKCVVLIYDRLRIVMRYLAIASFSVGLVAGGAVVAVLF